MEEEQQSGPDGQDDGAIEDMQEVVFSDMEDVAEDSGGEDGEGEMDPESSDVVLTPLREDAAMVFTQHKGSVFSISVDTSGNLACSGGEDDQALVWKVADGSIVFQCHGSVFSISVDTSGNLACSGGEDDQALVWKVADGSIVFQCHGHKDSVTCTGFSHDSKYLATADMAGLIQVWATATGKLVWSFETGDIEWLKWHPQAHVLLVGGSDGSGWMWKVPSGECKIFQGESARNSCAALTSDGKRICCGYDNGVIKVLSLKEGVPLVSLTSGQGHAKAVTCLDTHQENVLLLTGSEDQTAKLINSNSGKVLAIFPAGFAPSSESSNGEGSEALSYGVEAVCFSLSLPVALTGSLSGVLGVWDLPTQKLRQKCVQPEGEGAGVVKICCSQQSPLAYTGCLDGVVRGWDLRSGQVVREWHGHAGDILDLTLLKSENALLSASDDNTVRIFQTS